MSMVRWFGKDARVGPMAETPVGSLCVHCGEKIEAGDEGFFYANEEPTPAHRECFFRAIFGSVAHQQKRCTCYVPYACNAEDEKGMSRREAARAALAYYEQQQKGGTP